MKIKSGAIRERVARSRSRRDDQANRRCRHCRQGWTYHGTLFETDVSHDFGSSAWNVSRRCCWPWCVSSVVRLVVCEFVCNLVLPSRSKEDRALVNELKTSRFFSSAEIPECQQVCLKFGVQTRRWVGSTWIAEADWLYDGS